MADLPRGVSVVEGASFVPTCDLCQWIGKDCWTRADAEKAARAHARSAIHRENVEGPRRG
jgi:hypothetical protein